jgi:hypothetical protein
MAVYWAVKGTRPQTQYALAHRSESGCVVLMHSTDEALGPGKYTFITCYEIHATVKYQHDNNVVLPYLQSASPVIILLTERQRTPEWFLLQKFCKTVTGAYKLLMSVHSHLGPVGAIWMRLIMTTVYNAYHFFNLSRTAAFLVGSDECKSFKDFQRIRARQCSFPQFVNFLRMI